MNTLYKVGRMKHIVYMRSILPLFNFENHVIYSIKYVIHFNSSKIMDIMNYRYKQSIRGMISMIKAIAVDMDGTFWIQKQYDQERFNRIFQQLKMKILNL